MKRELMMKKLYVSIVAAILCTSPIFATPCSTETKHCYKKEVAVPDELFDRSWDCGFNPEKIIEFSKQGDRFAHDVIMLALYKQHYAEAKAQGHDKIAEDLKTEMGEYIANLSGAGLLPEQIAKVPPRNNFNCKHIPTMKQPTSTSASSSQHTAILEDVVEGAPKFQDKHPVINIFTTDSKHFGPQSKIDFCKLEACNYEIRDKGQPESMCTALSNYMSVKDSIKNAKAKKLPPQMAEALIAQLDAQAKKTEKEFKDINVAPKILRELPAWSEFRKEVQSRGCEKKFGTQH
jgi:hypothetical protein